LELVNESKRFFRGRAAVLIRLRKGECKANVKLLGVVK
jgi:hypothetical protein